MVSSTVKKYLNNTIIYPIFGNHACFPINQYQFIDNWIPGPFCDDWQLSDAIRFDLQLHSAYNVRHKLTNLRLIALDTQVGNAGNYYLAVNATDPQGLLTWLYNQLLAAEKAKDVVYIYSHIPPGDQDCLSDWSRHINVLFDRFEYTIAGLFYGHTHTDEFHVNRGVYSGNPTKIQWIIPSVTTYSFHNPSFRVYTADEDTKLVVNFDQYRLNLTKANFYPNTPPTWDLAYSFKEFYGVPDLSPQSVYELALNIGNNQELALKYFDNFYSGNSPVSACDIQCQHLLFCKLTYGISDDIFNCQGIEKGAIFKFNEMIFPPWSYKVK